MSSNPGRSACDHLVRERLLAIGVQGTSHAASPRLHFLRSPEAGQQVLRLAVKDLIDIKGEVTSAGSEYLYKHAKPAKEDAACLRIARKRGVAIVGKTNLKRLLHVQKHRDCSHRIQTELRELHVVVNRIRLRRTEVPPQALLELSGYVVHILMTGFYLRIHLHRSCRNTLVACAQAMHRDHRSSPATHLCRGLQAGEGDQTGSKTVGADIRDGYKVARF